MDLACGPLFIVPELDKIIKTYKNNTKNCFIYLNFPNIQTYQNSLISSLKSKLFIVSNAVLLNLFI